ncbi:DNA integrity scanning protein DisA [Candidatus Pacearchaeota archaeon]|nr:DNA integrity scanning protein DisA [Candidatus Pacearchaeota archaeon]
MDEKKDVRDIQQTIIGNTPIKEKASEEEFFNVIRIVAPGTNMRTALDGVLKAGKGALIAVESDWLPQMCDGGFRLNSKFTPQKLIELSKMDGAIVLSRDMKRILSANVLLTPDSKTPTNETGTRHKSGERAARQAGTLVIAVSERRNEITLYYKNIRYHLADSKELLRKANEHIQMLEKQRELFDRAVTKLTQFELRNYPSLSKAIHVIQKGITIQKISADLKKYIVELGKEGTLLKTRLKEIISDVEKETDLVIKDYTKLDLKKSKPLLHDLSYEDLLDKGNIWTIMGYESLVQTEPIKGWRILSKTNMLEQDIAAIVRAAGSLGKAIYSNIEFHKNIIGEEKSKAFKEEIENLKMNF